MTCGVQTGTPGLCLYLPPLTVPLSSLEYRQACRGSPLWQATQQKAERSFVTARACPRRTDRYSHPLAPQTTSPEIPVIRAKALLSWWGPSLSQAVDTVGVVTIEVVVPTRCQPLGVFGWPSCCCSSSCGCYTMSDVLSPHLATEWSLVKACKKRVLTDHWSGKREERASTPP